MPRRGSRSVALALVALPLVLTSCSLPGEAVASAPPVKKGAKVGGTVTVGVTRPGGIDPVNAYEPVGKLISSTMCDTVVTLDPVTGQVREGLAKSLVFSPDGSTLTFKMRRGLRFNDGSELGPKDVDFSYQLLFAKSTASYVRGLVEPFAAGISGTQGGKAKEESVLAEDFDSGKNRQPIAQALNEADFQMFAGKGNGGAVRALAEPAMAPISEKAYRKDPLVFARNPVCVGPYRLEKPYLPGDRAITLVRSAGYHAENVGYTGGGKGYLDRIVFRIYPTPDLAYAGYAKGEVDLVAVPPGKVAEAAARYGRQLVRGSATAVDYLGVPTGLDPWSNVALRQALSLALDRTALARTLGGAVAPGTGFLPPALNIGPGDNAIRTGALQAKASKGASFTGCPETAPARPAAARAKALLAQARNDVAVKEGLAKPLVLYVNTDGPFEAMARQAAAQWKAVLGLAVEVKALRWADYLQKATQGPGFDGAFHQGWASDATAPVALFNDAQAFLDPVFTSQGPSNWAHWSSTDFDFAFTEDAAKETDVASRGRFFRTLEKMLCEELPAIPVAFTSPTYLVRQAKLVSARSSYLTQSTGMPVLRELHLR